MKSFCLFILGIVIGYLVSHNKTEAQVTYNTLGHKVVVVTSDTIRNAAISAGKECGEDGYSMVGSGKEGENMILTVECSEKEN